MTTYEFPLPHGRSLTLTLIPGIIAISDGSTKLGPHKTRPVALEVLKEWIPNAEEVAQGFLQSNWLITDENLAEDHEQIRPVLYREQTNSIVIGSCRADIQFVSGLSEEQARRILAVWNISVDDFYSDLRCRDDEGPVCDAMPSDITAQRKAFTMLDALINVKGNANVEWIEPHAYQRISNR